MRPSRDKRCARRVAIDFVIGLMLFVAIFALATLDSRAARSAPAFLGKAVLRAHTDARPPALLVRLERPAANRTASPRPRVQPLSSEDLPFIAPEDRIYDKKYTGPGEGSAKRLASNSASKRTRSHAIPGMEPSAARRWALSVMALIFAMMTALTLGLWRHLRSSVVPRRRRPRG